MSTIEEFRKLLDSITILAITFRENVWFSILCSIVFAVAIAFMVSRIVNIKHKYRAKLKEKLNDVLFCIESDSEVEFEPIWKRAEYYHHNNDCASCIHPLGSFFGTLHDSLFKGTYQMLLTEIHEFDFSKKYSEADYAKKIEDLAIRIRNKSQYRMKQTSKGLGKLIESTNDVRFSESSSVDKMREVFSYASELKKEEKAEMLKTIILPWMWFLL